MIGGYQIIDLNQCVLDTGVYYWFPKIAPDFRKPLRLQGIKGKSTNNPVLDTITDWAKVETATDSDGIKITYTYNDATADVDVEVVILNYDIGNGCYGGVTITDNT